ncbi:MAG: hypothetical protein EOP54_07595 [Sphingobacteriales bacterium]|nr:MAG: hypothetical protein EOP54_07595 [Sphingobacteriales bacterium]
MKNAACILSFLFLVSCKPLLLKMYQIKDPAVETKAGILKAALRYGMDTSGILTASADDFLATLSTQSLPDIAVFDSAGAYIEYRRTDTSCNSGLFDFIPSLHAEGSYKKTGRASLQEELKKLRDINGDVISAPVEKADFYLLIYWSVWTGKLNKDHVKVWEQLAMQNKKCTIKVFKVNLDIQEYWPATTKAQLLRLMAKRK